MRHEVEITGTSPLLQHRFAEAEEARKSTRAVHVGREDPREEAERHAYRVVEGMSPAPAGTLYFPGAALARLLREGGGSHKQRGSRKSIKYVIPSAVLVEDDVVPLSLEGQFLSEIEVDSRPVVIPATKGRIMRHRARVNSWGATFSLSIDDTLVDEDLVHQILVEGGSRIGLGDFRPEKGGPFGRFRVTGWKAIK